MLIICRVVFVVCFFFFGGGVWIGVFGWYCVWVGVNVCVCVCVHVFWYVFNILNILFTTCNILHNS